MYVKVTNGAVDQYPYTIGELRRDNPNTSFPKNPSAQMLEDWGMYPVSTTQEPSYDAETQYVTPASTPTLENGTWVIGWTVVDKTAEEIASNLDAMASMNRSTRNELLAATDFHALTDVTLSDSMSAYRQALRDITSHANWPYLDAADWPTEPNE
jgi:hypothetical protein